ncbi:IPExxxVDY family protein [Mesonia aquimarina]|uniref:IPExxxVDY family protein n=1 Tax=Mesonia aquimarina TaxID=1504967 RepID=UPI000EF56345|nr:IPExxxVDY family protein [Mesonia aquimarina]
MTVNKLVLDAFTEDDYKLIAIHSSIEAYKLAFFLNKLLDIKLAREECDVDFNHKHGIAYYPLFSYFSKSLGCNYYLVANKYKIKREEIVLHDQLFLEEEKITTHLLPEYKNVDYLLKVEDSTEMLSVKKLLLDINKIQQVVTAYEVDISTLKSNENLIFN